MEISKEDLSRKTRGMERAYFAEKNVFEKHKRNFFSSERVSSNDFYEKHFVVHTEEAQSAIRKHTV